MNKEQSVLGTLIDSPLEDFKKEVSKLNVGVINNLTLLMESCYHDLNTRRELIMSSPSISLDDKATASQGIFCEMLKIEEKVSYLKKVSKDLIPEVFDTKK